MSKSRIFLLFLIAFLVGVFWASIWEANELIKSVIIGAGILILIIDPKNSKNVMLFFVSWGLFLGLWRTEVALDKIYPRTEVAFEGRAIIINEPVNKGDYQQIRVCPNIGNSFDCANKYLINAALYPEYQYAEQIKITCQLTNPENKYEKFNYIRFLAKDNIYQLCKKAEIKKTVTQDYISVSFWVEFSIKINLFKKVLEEKVGRLFAEPEGGYLGGLLLGGDDRLPEEVAENFRRTGTTHTVAVSGYNITILAQFLMILGITLGLWRQKAFYLAIVGIIFFVLMIGAPASALRAAIMGGLILWANKRGRMANSYRAIVLAGAIMVAFSPLILVYDVGFQLSFLATLAIVLIYGPLAEKMNIKNDFLGLKSIFWVTVSAQLGVLGILIYNFESLSLISLLANLIILPAVPIIMLCGFGVIILSFISFSLAKIISLPVWLGLHLEIKAIEYLAKIPWAIIDIKNIHWLWLVGYYTFFILLVIWLRKKK